MPAIEVLDSRIANWQIGIVDTVAAHASSGVYVLGTRLIRLEDFDPRLCGMVMTRSGESISLGIGAACLGNPILAALWLARKMLEVGRAAACRGHGAHGRPRYGLCGGAGAGVRGTQ